jgi:hypothetical protein
MASQIYVMPTIGTGGDHDPRRPKYSAGIETWGMLYDPELSTTLCAMVAVVTPAQDAAIRANGDVHGLPLPQNANKQTRDLATKIIETAVATFDFFDAPTEI